MLAADVVGDSQAAGVLLLHGWPLDRSIWQPITALIASAGFRLLVPDLPGFGGSPPIPADDATVERYADEVARFVRSAAPGGVAVAGHSFGGYVALALAERHPDSVRGLGLIASRTLADSPAARAGRQETIRKVVAGGTRALLPDLPEKLLAETAPAALRDRAVGVVARAPPAGVIAGLAAMAARPDRGEVFARFPGPALVIHGDADRLIPVGEAAPGTGRAGPTTRRILAGIGHMPMWEAPGETASAVLDWARIVHGVRAPADRAKRARKD